MDDQIAAYLDDHHAAAMITQRPDRRVHAVRCGVAVVDGRLWSSGTQQRVRTANLRRNPECTLFVFGASTDDPYSYLTLETTATILEGPDAPELNWSLFSAMQAGMNPPSDQLYWNGTLTSRDDFLAVMVDEQRLIYEFAIHASYGLFSTASR
ncbi:MAG TPA: pyridoxamine 5'-phosphate oxidase family protein [Microlunatus sp.]